MKKRLSAVLFDIEGVLSRGSRDPVKPLFFHHIQNGTHKVPFGVCTGRQQPYVERVLQELGPRAMEIPSIVENGCFLVLGAQFVPHPALVGHEEEFAGLKRTLESHFAGRAVVLRGKEVCVSLRPKSSSVEALYEQVRRVVEKDIMWARITQVAHSSTAVDITPAGVDKGTGFECWCKYTNIDDSNVLVVGDANNDLPILTRAGVPACPANGSEEVKKVVRARGGYVAQESYEGGTLEILKYFDVL